VRQRAAELAAALERERRREKRALEELRAEERRAETRRAQLQGRLEDQRHQKAERMKEELDMARRRTQEVEADLNGALSERRARSETRRRRRRREQEQDAKDRDQEAREAMLIGAAAEPSRPAPQPAAPTSAPTAPEAMSKAAAEKKPASRRVGFGFGGRAKPHVPASARRKVLSNFGADDDEERPARAVVPIDYSDDDEPAPGPGVSGRVPETLAGVLAHAVDWAHFSEVALEGRIRPWVSGRLRELLGQEEASLEDFIAGKLRVRAPPQEVLDELTPMLEGEAGDLVRGLYQRVIEETLQAA